MNVDILDGGLGTTLEDVFNVNISTTPLWSAKLLVDDPDALVKAHLAFLEAGATVIQTATYQCSFEAFAAAGHERDEAIHLMRRAVHLADNARSLFLSSRASEKDKPNIRIALSLGPFGAALSPGQEYGGIYPTPYGPQAYIPSGDNRNAFTADERTSGLEDAAVRALKDWHLSRLRIFTDDAPTWAAIDLVAFETIPLQREARAIGVAMAELRQSGAPSKEWWLSGVFPSGRAPDASAGGAGTGVKDLVRALAGGERPTGFGINCTAPEFMYSLVSELQAEIAHVAWKPWLVLYPNGGGIYDPVTRTWSAENGVPNGGWAHGLRDIVQQVAAGQLFSRILVGGCCKTTPDDIAALKELFRLNGVD